MLDIQLYILGDGGDERYGRRVRRFSGPVNLESVLNEELEIPCGRMLITGEPLLRAVFFISDRKSFCQPGIHGCFAFSNAGSGNQRLDGQEC